MGGVALTVRQNTETNQPGRMAKREGIEGKQAREWSSVRIGGWLWERARRERDSAVFT